MRLGVGLPGAYPNYSQHDDPRRARPRLQGYLAHKKTLTPLRPPKDSRRRPTEGYLGGRFLMSEVPLSHTDVLEGFTAGRSPVEAS